MSDPDQEGSSAQVTSNVPDFVHDFRKQQDVLQHQAGELARLRAELLNAAEREAVGIVSGARAEIRRIIVNARRELLGLATQIHTITESPDKSEIRPTSGALLPAEDGMYTRDRLLGARHEVRDVLEEARPELDHLMEEALVLRPGPQPQPIQPVPEPVVASHLPEPPPAFEQVDPDVVVAGMHRGLFEEPTLPQASGRFAWVWVTLFALTGLGIVAGTAWLVMRGWPDSTVDTSRPESASSAIASPRGQTVERPVTRSVPDAAAAPSAPSELRPPPLSVRVEVLRPAWIRTTVDGQADAGRVYRAGETNTIRGDREVVIRAGNAGAVSVSFNGSAPKVLGADGEVVTRRFAPDETAASPTTNPPPPSTGTLGPQSTPGTPAASAAAQEIPAVSSPPSSPTGQIPSTPPIPPTSTGGAGPASDAGPELARAAERWLDAYYRQDANGMAAISTRDVRVSDARDMNERLPAGLAARRTLERVTFQFVGESAILTARVAEQVTVDGAPRQYISWISQVWIHEGPQWRLMDVRLLSDAKLK